MDKLKEKLQSFIDEQCKYADKNGSTSFATCGSSSYGWDKDIWNHIAEIRSAIEKRGYTTSSSVNHGVTDIRITKNLDLS